VIERSARETVDRLAGTSGEGECDFAIDVGRRVPGVGHLEPLRMGFETDPHVVQGSPRLLMSAASGC